MASNLVRFTMPSQGLNETNVNHGLSGSATEWNTTPVIEYRIKHLSCWQEHVDLFNELYPIPNTKWSRARETLYAQRYKQLSCQREEQTVEETMESIRTIHSHYYEELSTLDQEIEEMLSDSESEEFEITITKKTHGADVA